MEISSFEFIWLIPFYISTQYIRTIPFQTCSMVARVLDSLVQDSSEALCCDLEQDSNTSALYWFNPGRQVIIPTWLKIIDLDVKHQHTQNELKGCCSWHNLSYFKTFRISLVVVSTSAAEATLRLVNIHARLHPLWVII